jgi:hypothetical protein
MKVTKSYIKQLIKEELANVLEGKGPEYERRGKTQAGQDYTIYVRSSNSGEPRYFLSIIGDVSDGKYQIGEEMANEILRNSNNPPKFLDNQFTMENYKSKDEVYNSYVHNM